MIDDAVVYLYIEKSPGRGIQSGFAISFTR